MGRGSPGWETAEELLALGLWPEGDLRPTMFGRQGSGIEPVHPSAMEFDRAMLSAASREKSSAPRPLPSVAEWKRAIAGFQSPSIRRAVWQIANTLIPYAGLWVAMYFTLAVSWWLTLPLAVLAGAFLVRVFIISHDCGHDSFLPSRRANATVGSITGFLALTPYYHWRWQHAVHHATTGDLDRRGSGDVWTMTVQEYLESSRWKRFAYRLARNPLVLFLIAPLLVFVIWQRFPDPKAGRRERRSVGWTNVALLATAVAMSAIYGVVPYLVLQFLVMGIAGVCGVWLFYVQHQFEGAYWERKENWDYTSAALLGSSYYKLPAVLRWFSGNIGFHHVHHLNPRIPNYYLVRCHEAAKLDEHVKPLTTWKSLGTMSLHLWDEKLRQLVSFRDIRRNRHRVLTSDSGESPNG